MSIQPDYNSTPYQRGLDAAIQPLRDLNLLVGDWNDPQSMIVALLPYKAHQLGCLAWSELFGEQYQRDAIAAAHELNEQAGSRAALTTLDGLLGVAHAPAYSMLSGGVARAITLTLISQMTYNTMQLDELRRIYSAYLPVWLAVTILIVRPTETGIAVGSQFSTRQEIRLGQ